MEWMTSLPKHMDLAPLRLKAKETSLVTPTPKQVYERQQRHCKESSQTYCPYIIST